MYSGYKKEENSYYVEQPRQILVKPSPRPKNSPYSKIGTMPEKQKKQIDFINEMFDKMNLNQTESF